GIAVDRFAVDFDTSGAAGMLPETRDSAEAQFCTLSLGRTHHRSGELSGMDLRGGFGGTEHLADRHLVRQPAEIMTTAATWEPGKPAIGVEPAIAPIIGKPRRQIRLQRKAALRQRRERRPVRPIAGQKPARFYRGGAREDEA